MERDRESEAYVSLRWVGGTGLLPSRAGGGVTRKVCSIKSTKIIPPNPCREAA